MSWLSFTVILTWNTARNVVASTCEILRPGGCDCNVITCNCEQCREAIGVFNHETSRECDNPKCRGQLHDSIINFGESLPKEELDKAFMNADKVVCCFIGLFF